MKEKPSNWGRAGIIVLLMVITWYFGWPQLGNKKYDEDELRFIFFLAAANKGSPAGKSNIASFLCKEKQYDKAAFWY